MFIGYDGALDTEFQPRRPGKLRFGRNADADERDVCTDFSPALDFRRDALPVRRQRLDFLRKAQIDAPFAQAGMENTSHIIIEGRHHLVSQLDEGDL